MNERHSSGPGLDMPLSDILYVLFRHKAKIILISTLGIIIALALPFLVPQLYLSEAKLLIRYVRENHTPIQHGPNDSRIKTPDERGDNLLSSELQILTSMDLGLEVARSTNTGLLDHAPTWRAALGARDDLEAAVLIRKNLEAEIVKKSNVIRVTFKHSNKQAVTPVLTELLAAYLKKHKQIHEAGELDTFLSEETRQLRNRLEQTEARLRLVKSNYEILSLDDARKLYSDERTKLQQQLWDAQAELAERKASSDAIAAVTPKATAGLTTPTTNGPLTDDAHRLSPQQIADYRQICDQLHSLRLKDFDYLEHYTDQNVWVKNIKSKIRQLELQKKQLENQTPELILLKTSDSKGPANYPSINQRSDLLTERAKTKALESKINTLQQQLQELKDKEKTLREAEGRLDQLSRQRAMQEARYKKISEAWEQSQIDERFGSGKVTNISKIQEPTLPTRASSKLRKSMALIVLASLAGALAFAFLTEFYLDQSLKQPIDIQTKLGLPLFLSFPRLPQHKLRPFYYALRDHFIAALETMELPHRPKLLALTSCAPGAGVSTIATGLASALAENGDGKVLLVRLNTRPSKSQAVTTNIACRLDEALETAMRHRAKIQENLYLVFEPADDDISSALRQPRNLKDLMSRLKASDYLYIIFDSPPVSQTSISPTLARFMDLLFMVVESEKTDARLAKAAALLLTGDSSNSLPVILNKTRNYVPCRWQPHL